MIDIENELYTAVKTAITNEYSDCYVTSMYVPTMPSFPAVTFIEENNTVYAPGRDSGGIENFANLMYEVNVYSNKESGKKAECKNIMAIIDGVMASKGFERTMLNPVPNLYDATIFRMTARYKAVVSTDKETYRS